MFHQTLILGLILWVNVEGVPRCPPLYIIERCDAASNANNNNNAQPSREYRYQVTATTQSWSASRRACQQLGGDLVVAGAKDFEARKKIFSSIPQGRWYWIGLSDPQHNRRWTWLDQSHGNEHWAANEPNNFHSYNEYCGEVDSSRLYKTNDYSCYANLYGVCEIPVNQQ
ncbi:unnamed protein product [Clavelina lepadiformis]|uniref:C-type lectin domain-containing protein n=1 Tax=Clavelina lepadiformis TaxID=159417 RepID=A0ABP0GW03_CLALP